MKLNPAVVATLLAIGTAAPASAADAPVTGQPSAPGLFASNPELCAAETELGSGEWRVSEQGVGSQGVCCPFDAPLSALPETGTVTVLPGQCTCPDDRAVTGAFTLIRKNAAEATLTFSEWEGVIVLKLCDAS